MSSASAGNPPQSPYRGVDSFRFVDREIYFGRAEAIDELVVKVLLSRLVLLFGESGTGKSSLINAGLIPALINEGFNPVRIRVRPIIGEPILIQRVQIGDDGEGPRFLPSIFDDQSQERQDPVEACSLERFVTTVQKNASTNLPVLIFDQFEELFTIFGQNKDSAAAEEIGLQQEILTTILQLASDSALTAKLLIIIREDFLGKLEVLQRDYPRVFDNRVRLKHLSETGAVQAIVGPFIDRPDSASRLDEGLANTVVQELSAGQLEVQIQPTQLQIVCSRLWEQYAATNPEITVQDFEEMNGVTGIVEGFLESELVRLGPELRPAAVFIMGGLITEAGTRDVISVQILRDVLSNQIGTDDDAFSATINFLEERRLVTRTLQRGTFYYEVASEYLIPPIQREIQLLTLERERSRAELAAREEVQQQRLEQDARSAKRFRRLAAGLAVAMVLAIGGATFGVLEARRADEKADLAAEQAAVAASETLRAQEAADLAAEQAAIAASETQRAQEAEAAANKLLEEARAQNIAFQALELLETDPQRSLLLALGAIGLVPTQEAQNALRQALASPVSPVKAVFDIRRENLFSQGGLSAVPITALAITPDGEKLITEGRGQTVIWDLKAEKAINVLKTEGNIIALKVTGDSRRVVVAKNDWSVEEWDLTSGEQLSSSGRRFIAEFPTVAVFSPDAQRVAIAADDATVRLQDVRSGAELTRLQSPDPDFKVASLVFNPEGTQLAIGLAGDGSAADIQLWDVHPDQVFRGRPRLIGIFKGHRSTVDNLAFNIGGDLLASVSDLDELILWDTGTLEPIAQTAVDTIFNVAFSRDGTLLAGGTRRGDVVLWDVADLRDSKGVRGQLSVFDGHVGSVNVVGFTPDGRFVGSGSSDETARLWRLNTGGPGPTTLGVPGDSTLDVSFSRDNKILAASNINTFGDRGSIRIWDAQTLTRQGGNEELAALSFEGFAEGVAISLDSQLMASVGFFETRFGETRFGEGFETLRIWDVSELENINQVGSAPQALEGFTFLAVAFSPTRNILGTVEVGFDRGIASIGLWDATGFNSTGALADIARFEVEKELPFMLAFSPDGNTLATSGDNLDFDRAGSGSVRLFDVANALATGELREIATEVMETETVNDLAFSPDGTHLAAGSEDFGNNTGSISLWDVSKSRETGKLEPVAVAQFKPGGVIGLAFSPDGAQLATSRTDSTTRLQDVSSIIETSSTTEELLIGRSSVDARSALDFSFDGGLIAFARDDGRISVLPLRLEDLISAACLRAAGESLSADEWTAFFGAMRQQDPCS